MNTPALLRSKLINHSELARTYYMLTGDEFEEMSREEQQKLVNSFRSNLQKKIKNKTLSRDSEECRILETVMAVYMI